jgi:regulator of nucleoside diphosphate kinase
MSHHNAVILTNRDYYILQAISMARQDHFDAASAMLARKLRRAIVVLPADLGPQVVTIGSWVRYRVGQGPVEERALVDRLAEDAAGLTEHVGTPLGVALIGMSIGQTATFPLGDGTLADVRVDAVLVQPQHTTGWFSAAASGAVRRSSNAAVGNVVHLLRVGQHTRHLGPPTPDEPGPTAA